MKEVDSARQHIKNRLLFLKRDAKLERRLKEDYICNGIAALPCRVTGIDDIISRFSVPGYETLSSELSEYIEETAAFIPPDYPIMLEFSGCRFTEEEKRLISRTVHEDYLYALGAVQHENRRQLIFAAVMLLFMLVTGLFTFFVKGVTQTVAEIIYIFFWFFADLVACYFFLDRFENRKKRLLAGRLADMTVRFSEEYDDSPLTEEETASVFAEIEKMTDSELEP